jgi:hypothetical protein
MTGIPRTAREVASTPNGAPIVTQVDPPSRAPPLPDMEREGQPTPCWITPDWMDPTDAVNERRMR